MEKIIIDTKCICCNRVVKPLFEARGYRVLSIEPGKIIINETLTSSEKKSLEKDLKDNCHCIYFYDKGNLCERIEVLIGLYVENYTIANGKSLKAFLCSQLGFSEEKIAYEFKKKNKISVNAFMKKKKIEHADSLLKIKEKNISEIALDLGYTEPKSFTKAYTAFKTYSPQEFRRRLSMNNEDSERL